MPRATRPYIKVHGQWRYLYRAIDRNGTLVDVMFSEHRDMAAAMAFFQSANTVTEVTPGSGDHGWPRQLSPCDPHDVGQDGAPPHQPLSQQSTGAGSPWHQRSLPADAWVQVPTIG